LSKQFCGSTEILLRSSFMRTRLAEQDIRPERDDVAAVQT